MTCDNGSESDSSNSDKEKKHCHINWRDTQECYIIHQLGNIWQYRPSTAPTESSARTETAPAAAITRISIVHYWMTTNVRDDPSEEWQNVYCTIMSHSYREGQKFTWHMKYMMGEEFDISAFGGSVTGKAKEHGDVRWRLQLHGGHRNEMVVRNVLRVDGAHNMLCQWIRNCPSQCLLNRDLWPCARRECSRSS